MSSHKHHSHEGCCSKHNQCSCSCHSCSCCQGDSCSQHPCQDHGDDSCHFSDQLLALADEAWMELLKEKIKIQIEKFGGKRLDELAKLANDANHLKWQHFFADKRSSEEYKHNLREYFHNEPGSKKRQ